MSIVRDDGTRTAGIIARHTDRGLWVRVEGKSRLFTWRDGRWVCEVLE